MSGHDGIQEYSFKKFTSILDRLAIEMNTCFEEQNIPECKTKERTTLIQRPPIKNRFKQLLTHNVPTDDVENANSIN